MSKTQISDFGEIYSSYAAGCLDPAFALLIETQAVLRPDVSRAIARAETIAGIFLDAETPTQLSDTALTKALAMIDCLESERAEPKAAVHLAGEALDELLTLPIPLREIALESCATESWKTLTSGIRRLTLDTDSQADVELYRIEPGKTVPKHSHKGGEFTLVVSGGFSDETGHYGPGDISVKGPEHTHQPTGDMDGVCFALAVSEGGLKFTGMMGVVQRILGQ